ncbi:integrase [Erythrobacter sp. Dej080120_24]|nr:integrase [Erythrobacter sp. Dej080120_24]
MGLVLSYIVVHASGRCDYRRYFPASLKPFVPGGQKLVKRSLGKPDDPQFDQLRRSAEDEYERLFRMAEKARDRAFDVLDAPTIAWLAETYLAEGLEADEEARWDTEERKLYRNIVRDLEQRGAAAAASWHPDDPLRWALKTRETALWSLDHHKCLRAAGDLEGIMRSLQEEAEYLLEAQGLVVDPLDVQGMQRLCRALNDASIRLAETKLERLDGKEVVTPALPFKQPTQDTAEAVRSTSKVPLMETFDAYAASQGLTPGVRDEWRRYLARLVEWLGHEDAAKLTTSDLRSWRDELLAEKTRKGTLRDPVTVRDKYITSVRATLNWAVEEQLLPLNVAKGVTVRIPKKPKRRDRSFTSEEAEAILRATLLKTPSRLSATHARARRWIPWLCAYSGARVNEFSQLRAEDVFEEDGIWAVRITPEAGSVKTKEARVVPLHPHLVEQEFLKVVEAVGRGPMFYNPSAQRVESDSSRHFKKVGERLAQWVREEVGIKDTDIKPNHAWRHTFKSLSYDAGIEERLVDAIQGHAPKTTGRAYGSPSLAAKAEAIKKIPRFEI